MIMCMSTCMMDSLHLQFIEHFTGNHVTHSLGNITYWAGSHVLHKQDARAHDYHVLTSNYYIFYEIVFSQVAI